MGHTITIREYEYLSLGKTTSDAEKTLSQSDFEALEKFILENNSDAVELMNLSIKKLVLNINLKKLLVCIYGLKNNIKKHKRSVPLCSFFYSSTLNNPFIFFIHLLIKLILFLLIFF